MTPFLIAMLFCASPERFMVGDVSVSVLEDHARRTVCYVAQSPWSSKSPGISCVPMWPTPIAYTTNQELSP